MLFLYICVSRMLYAMIVRGTRGKKSYTAKGCSIERNDKQFFGSIMLLLDEKLDQGVKSEIVEQAIVVNVMDRNAIKKNDALWVDDLNDCVTHIMV